VRIKSIFYKLNKNNFGNLMLVKKIINSKKSLMLITVRYYINLYKFTKIKTNRKIELTIKIRKNKLTKNMVRRIEIKTFCYFLN